MSDELIKITLLGDFSTPANTLIEKISDAMGGIAKPFQAIRMAKAEAKADLIKAESQIQVTTLHRRAISRFIEEEAKKQHAIEAITQNSFPFLKASSKPENLDNDWITNFFDKCRVVSNQDMQLLWSKLLAGEANSPGTFSRKTINLVADLDKSDAELFSRLCSFNWKIGDFIPLIYDVQNSIYTQHQINFNSLSHLKSLGLIQFGEIASFSRLELSKKFEVLYFAKPISLTLPKDSGNTLEIGHVLLTKAGQELATICKSTPIDGFFEYIYAKWTQQKYIQKEQT